MSSPNVISVDDHVALRSSGQYIGVVESVGDDEHGVNVRHFGVGALSQTSILLNFGFDELEVCEKISA